MLTKEDLSFWVIIKWQNFLVEEMGVVVEEKPLKNVGKNMKAYS